MNKKVYRIAILMFFVFLNLNMYYYATSTTDYPKPEYDIDPYLGQTRVHARLYYVDGNRLNYETIDYQSNLSYGLEELLERYISQPHEHANTLEVLDMYEEQNKIYVNLGRNSFRNPKYSEQNIHLYVTSLVNTLTELQTPKQVQFLFEGRILKERILNFDFQRPLVRDETVIYTSVEDMAEVYANFVEELEAGDFQSAISMLSFHESGVIRQPDLHEQLEQYAEAVSHYQNKSVRVLNRPQFWEVVVQAETPAGPITESWEIMRVDKRFYINYASSPLVEIQKKD